MGLRTGDQYVEAVRRAKNIYVNGQRVEDVAQHPATRAMLSTMSSVYELQQQSAHQDVLTCRSEYTGNRISSGYLLPHTKEDLYRRKEMIEFLAFNFGGGVATRLPEYMGLILVGMLNIRKKLCRQNPQYEKNLEAYYIHVSEEDLALTHAFSELRVNRALGRNLPAAEGYRVTEERGEGVVVEGARGVATLAPFCDELFGWNSSAVPEKALYFSHPIAMSGLRIYCREPAAPGRSPMDRPLAGRYDELDAYTFYENAVIPWDRIYMKGDVEIAGLGTAEGLLWGSWHVLIRQTVKTLVFVGLTAAIAEYLGTTTFPNVQEEIAELMVYAEVLRALVVASIEGMRVTELGYAAPSYLTTTCGRTFFNMQLPRMLHLVQELAGSSMIMAPTEADLRNEDIGRWLESSFAGVGASALQKMKLFKLAWDLACSDFGGRQVLFELFNFGTPLTNRGRLFGMFDTAELVRKVKAIAGIEA